MLSLLRDSKLYAKLSKCNFLKHEIDFLGHVISADGIKVDPRKLEFVQKWLQPTDIKGSRSFLGLATFLRRFCQEFSSLAAPLTSLLRNKVPWDWNSECDNAFRGLKAKLTSAPVIAMPNFDPPFEVWSNASGFGIGAVLLQHGRPCILNHVSWRAQS